MTFDPSAAYEIKSGEYQTSSDVHDVKAAFEAENNDDFKLSGRDPVLGGKLSEEDSFVVNFLLPFANFCAYFSVPPIDTMPPNIAAVWRRFVNGDQQYRDSKLKLLPVVVDGPWIVKKAVGPGTASVQD